jgi:hypothetical protein
MARPTAVAADADEARASRLVDRGRAFVKVGGGGVHVLGVARSSDRFIVWRASVAADDHERSPRQYAQPLEVHQQLRTYQGDVAVWAREFGRPEVLRAGHV